MTDAADRTSASPAEPPITAPGEHHAPPPITHDADATPLDLDAIGRDLAGVEVALARLDDGSYWRDEVTGAELPDELLSDDPLARRA